MFALTRIAALALWALSVLTLVFAFSPSRLTRAETNAHRLSRGLPPSRPRRLYSATKTNAPRAAPSGAPGATVTGCLAFTTAGTTNVIGYAGSYGFFPTQPSWVYTFSIPDSSEELFTINSDYGMLGGVAQVPEVTLGPTTASYVWLVTDEVGATPVGATEGTYGRADGLGQGYAQNTIWSIDLSTGKLTPHWVNPDGTIATQYIITGTSDSAFSYITGDPVGAEAALGGGQVLVDLYYIPASS